MSRLPTKKGTRRSAPAFGGEFEAAQAIQAEHPMATSDDASPQDAGTSAGTAFRSRIDRVLARFAPAHVVINGAYEVVQGLEIDEVSRARIDASVAELAEERDAVAELGLI